MTDQVDSVKVVTDDNGIAITRTEYLPFGETWFQEDKPGHEGQNTPKYNSQELDKESGYYFYNARHYDPEIARFVTADTVIDGENSTQGWNRYAYVHNNPIRYKDPTGHNIVVLKAEEGGPGFDTPGGGHKAAGHTAALVQDKSADRWTYFSRNGKDSSGSRLGGSNSAGYTFKNPDAFFDTQAKMVKERSALEKQKTAGKISDEDYQKKLKANPLLEELTEIKNGKVGERYDKGLEIKTTSKQDTKMKLDMYKHIDDQYLFLGNNCKDLVTNAMNKAGIKSRTVAEEAPNKWYDRFKDYQQKKGNVEWEYNAKDYQRDKK